MSTVLGLGLNILKRDIVAAISGAVYGFDGSTMYAIMGTAWSPGGLPYTISGKFRPENTTSAAILSSVGDGLASGILVNSPAPTTQYAYQDNPPPGSSFLTNSEETANGEIGTFSFTMAASGGSGFINDVAVIPDTQLPLSSTISGISHIAAVADFLTLFEFGGAIWDLQFNDNSPLQNRKVCVSNKGRYVLLNNSIVLPAADDYTINFDWKRENNVQPGSTGLTKVLGSTDGVSSIIFNDTANAAPNRVQTTNPGTNVVFLSPAEPLARVALGQIANVSLQKMGTTHILSIDGEVIESKAVAGTGDFTIERFYRGDFNPLGVGAYLGNISIVNDTTGDSWFYALEELTA